MVWLSNDKHGKELIIPPQAQNDPKSIELARVWEAGGKQVTILRPDAYEDPAAWGLMMVDFAKHVSNAYEQTGKGSKEEVLKRIKWGFDVEWDKPTDEPRGKVHG